MSCDPPAEGEHAGRAVSGRSLHVHARHGKKVVADIQMMLRLHVTAAIGIDER